MIVRYNPCSMVIYSALFALIAFEKLSVGHYFNSPVNLGTQGSFIVPTKGQPWPMPQIFNPYNNDFLIVRPTIFQFNVTGHSCNMLEDALKRYYNLIFQPMVRSMNKNKFYDPRGEGGNKYSMRPWKNSSSFVGYLNTLEVSLLGPCEEYPHDQMNELYELVINPPQFQNSSQLQAFSIWGILRGLETFSQLLVERGDFPVMEIRALFVYDYPRFPYRSILLDTSRHYLSTRVIKQNLDLMAMNKYNVFHWHIVDDQSFPYQSKTFPNLSAKGAYHPYTHIYTQSDIQEIIEYARVRGIRVIPEFDTPGHTQSWRLGSIPGFLTECYYPDGSPTGTYGPVNPIQAENYDFLKRLFKEIFSTFNDKYVHLGGDEVDFTCWKSNPNITSFMQSVNMTSYEKLEEFYMQKLTDIISSFPDNNSYIVWQEVVDNGVELDENAVVHVWKGNGYSEEMAQVTSLGYRVLLSACWYLDYISTGADWVKYYQCDPQDFKGNDTQKNLIIGGGPALWGEMVDSTNVTPRLWPRACAPAERLWSNANVTDVKDAAARLEEHRCRLVKRGFSVQPPNGPGFCPVVWE